MSKFLKIMIVLLTIVAVATPVIAEDRLGLSGQMRVRGWHLDDGGDDTQGYWDQRLRIGGKFSIAEGVSVTFRTDFSEQDWGTNSLGRTSWQLDRSHLDVTKGMVHLRAGQQYFGLGQQFAVDTQDTGAVLNFKTAIPVQLAYILTDDNGASGADDAIIAVQVSHKTDLYSANVFVANARNRDLVSNIDDAIEAAVDAGDAVDADDYFANVFDANDFQGEDITVVGVDTTFDLDAVDVSAALAFFTGDYVEELNVDAVGTQFNLGASMAASEAVTVGGAFYYAMAADEDEVQVTSVGNGFNGYDPVNYGPLENEDLFAYGNRVFDFTGANAGVMGLQLYTNAKVSDAAAVTASVAYLQPEDDDMTDVDSDIVANIGATYEIMANVQAAAQIQFIERDDEADTDSKFAGGAALYVNF